MQIKIIRRYQHKSIGILEIKNLVDRSAGMDLEQLQLSPLLVETIHPLGKQLEGSYKVGLTYTYYMALALYTTCTPRCLPKRREHSLHKTCA